MKKEMIEMKNIEVPESILSAIMTDRERPHDIKNVNYEEPVLFPTYEQVMERERTTVHIKDSGHNPLICSTFMLW